ncbi:TIGR01440 family protein [Sinanaerobacter sp. ZZT-01]|uniref:TIGR01440 family protein n=1 Tax=Sinanaerobacter sp. ZZT-01 TaxID=3111540 RepID=UPI002D77E316|nr:TIGR01440 family protein [Sinanaerobacter sp. ZZT-01]WRR92422.1 TIGR01440 family protein [Sinanaerobacter sp. ZZT-01]
MYEEIIKEAHDAVCELLEIANLKEQDILVVGCSSSEVGGHKIGSDSSVEIAKAVFDGIYPIVKEKKLFLATQCCEHLNRALIVEREAAEKYNLEIVNVIPQPKAGGAFSANAYKTFSDPVAVEEMHCAKAGMDIGNTLIGMHLKKVAVPVRLNVKKIGEAHLVCARTRLKFVGGERAHYDESLK